MKTKMVFVSLFVAFSLNVFAMSKSKNNVARGYATIVNIGHGISYSVKNFFGKGKSSSSTCLGCQNSFDKAHYENPYTSPEPNYNEPVNNLNPISAPVRWANQRRGAMWTDYTLAAIEREKLHEVNPRDASVYCPNWNKLSLEERKLFWLALSSKLAELESSFRSGQSFAENIGSSKGTRSNGLFSMSVGDKCRMFRSEADTFNDKKNIDCAIRTMKNLLSSQAYIGTGANRGLGRYWQPFNDNPKHYIAQTKRNKQSILTYTRNLPYCR